MRYSKESFHIAHVWGNNVDFGFLANNTLQFPLPFRLPDPVPDRTYSRSASPPENGFRQYLETRMFSSQGKGPSRTERTPHIGGRSSYEPPRSHSRVQVLPSTAPGGGGGHYSRRLDQPSNGYDTDSSQDSRVRQGNGEASRSRPSRAWKPMREALNVDSVIGGGGGQERRQHSPRRRPASQERALSQERERDQDRTWGGGDGRDDRKPKSLMTIYEDELKHETGGSRSLLDSEGRGGHGDKDRSKGTATLKVRNDNWKIQRTESEIGRASCRGRV